VATRELHLFIRFCTEECPGYSLIFDLEASLDFYFSRDGDITNETKQEPDRFLEVLHRPMKLIIQRRKIITPEAYTLVEVIVAVLVLSVMLVSLYGGFSSGFAVVKLARENLRATQIMMQKMETVRLLKWSQVLDTNTFLQPAFQTYYDPSSTNAQSVGAIYLGFVSTSAVRGVSADYAANMRVVTVTIYWTNYLKGATNIPIVRTRQMQTLVARYGMQNYVYK